MSGIGGFLHPLSDLCRDPPSPAARAASRVTRGGAGLTEHFVDDLGEVVWSARFHQDADAAGRRAAVEVLVGRSPGQRDHRDRACLLLARELGRTARTRPHRAASDRSRRYPGGACAPPPAPRLRCPLPPCESRSCRGRRRTSRGCRDRPRRAARAGEHPTTGVTCETAAPHGYEPRVSASTSATGRVPGERAQIV